MDLALSWENLVLWPGYPATAPDRARYFLNRRRAAAAAPMPSRLTPRMASDAGSGAVNCFSTLEMVPPGFTPTSSITRRLVTGAKFTVCRRLSLDETVTPLDKLATSKTLPRTPSSSNSKLVIGVAAGATTLNVSSASADVVPVLFQNALNPIPGKGVNAGPTPTEDAGTFECP